MSMEKVKSFPYENSFAVHLVFKVVPLTGGPIWSRPKLDEVGGGVCMLNVAALSEAHSDASVPLHRVSENLPPRSELSKSSVFSYQKCFLHVEEKPKKKKPIYVWTRP